jgi:hypothetical protein
MSKKYTKKHLESFFHHNFGGSWFSDFTGFLKNHRIISKGLSYAAPFLGKYGALAEVGANIADKLGYGTYVYNIKDLERYAKHKFGGSWLGHVTDFIKNTYHKVKDHVNNHKDFYGSLVSEFKPVNKILNFGISKTPLDDDAKNVLHTLNNKFVGFGENVPMTKKQKNNKRKIKEQPLKQMYGKGLASGQIP